MPKLYQNKQGNVYYIKNNKRNYIRKYDTHFGNIVGHIVKPTIGSSMKHHIRQFLVNPNNRQYVLNIINSLSPNIKYKLCNTSPHLISKFGYTKQTFAEYIERQIKNNKNNTEDIIKELEGNTNEYPDNNNDLKIFLNELLKDDITIQQKEKIKTIADKFGLILHQDNSSKRQSSARQSSARQSSARQSSARRPSTQKTPKRQSSARQSSTRQSSARQSSARPKSVAALKQQLGQMNFPKIQTVKEYYNENNEDFNEKILNELGFYLMDKEKQNEKNKEIIINLIKKRIKILEKSNFDENIINKIKKYVKDNIDKSLKNALEKNLNKEEEAQKRAQGTTEEQYQIEKFKEIIGKIPLDDTKYKKYKMPIKLGVPPRNVLETYKAERRSQKDSDDDLKKLEKYSEKFKETEKRQTVNLTITEIIEAIKELPEAQQKQILANFQTTNFGYSFY